MLNNTQIDINGFSPSNVGTTGQVLKKTSGGYGWSSAGETYCTQSEYDQLTPDSNINYIIYEPFNTLYTSAEIVSMANSEGYPWTNTLAVLNSNASGYWTELQSDCIYDTFDSSNNDYYIFKPTDVYYAQTSGGGGGGGGSN